MDGWGGGRREIEMDEVGGDGWVGWRKKKNRNG